MLTRWNVYNSYLQPLAAHVLLTAQDASEALTALARLDMVDKHTIGTKYLAHAYGERIEVSHADFGEMYVLVREGA